GIAEPDRRPSTSSIQRIAWIGVAASILGIVLSALVMMFEVTQLLLYFLRAPQAGVPVFQTTSGGPASWVSASDILSLMGLTFAMLVEVFVLALVFGCCFELRSHSPRIVWRLKITQPMKCEGEPLTLIRRRPTSDLAQGHL